MLGAFVSQLRDGLDGDFCPRLTMTNVAAVTCLWFVLDDRDLLSTTMLHNLRSDLAAGDDWRTNLHACAVVTCDEHWFEGNELTFLHVDFFHREGLAFRDEVLFATTSNNCVHSGIVLRRR